MAMSPKKKARLARKKARKKEVDAALPPYGKSFNPFSNMEPGTPNLFQVDPSAPIPAVAQDFDASGALGEPRLVDLRDGYAPALTPRQLLELCVSTLPFAPRDVTYADAARRDPVFNFFGSGR